MTRGARKVWRRTIAPGIAAGLIHPTLDQAVAFVFCSYRAELSELDAAIRANPNVDVGLDPALLRTMRRRDAAADKLLRYASELGLSPTSRLRLGHRETEKKLTTEDIRAMLRSQSEQPPKTEVKPPKIEVKATSKAVH